MVQKSRRNRSNQKVIFQHGCASTRKYNSLAKNRRQRQNRRQLGGSHFLHEFSNKVLPPVPNALVGPSWSPTSIGSNHYAKNNYNAQLDYNPKQEGNQIQLSGKTWGKMWGGKRKQKINQTKKLGNKLKGGNMLNQLIPSDLINVGRYASWNANNLYNGYNGYASTVNPLPWNQPALLKTGSHFLL